MRPPQHHNRARDRDIGRALLLYLFNKSPAGKMITAERDRQIAVEGWSVEHDDEHADGELLKAAMCYFAHARGALPSNPDGSPMGWPWESEAWKPKDRERDLVRAGALCIAERERLARKSQYYGHVDAKLYQIAKLLETHPPS